MKPGTLIYRLRASRVRGLFIVTLPTMYINISRDYQRLHSFGGRDWGGRCTYVSTDQSAFQHWMDCFLAFVMESGAHHPAPGPNQDHYQSSAGGFLPCFGMEKEYNAVANMSSGASPCLAVVRVRSLTLRVRFFKSEKSNARVRVRKSEKSHSISEKANAECGEKSQGPVRNLLPPAPQSHVT